MSLIQRKKTPKAIEKRMLKEDREKEDLQNQKSAVIAGYIKRNQVKNRMI